MLIHYFLILLFSLTIPITPATTNAVAEDAPFGQSLTFLRFSNYQGYISIANSDSGGSAYVDAAIVQADRAVNELL